MNFNFLFLFILMETALWVVDIYLKYRFKIQKSLLLYRFALSS